MDIYEKTTQFYESATGEKRIIGKSVFGRNLYAVKIGNGAPVGIAQYAIHGREFITAELAFLHAEIGVKGSFWILPLTNPDGALLSQIGLSSAPKEERKNLISLNSGQEDFSLWKANGRGVDLNVNFAARWGQGVKNVRVAGAENYIGKKPFSESETLALKTFTEQIQPDYTVSYHTKGEEIYWYFHQRAKTCFRDEKLADALSISTGYPLKMASGSVGGYKDWCIACLCIPAFTVEAGRDELKHPIQEEGLENILTRNKNALLDLSRAYGDEKI